MIKIMKTFLQLVADDLYKKLDGDFQNTTIIFPNKRATLFFNEYLWKNANGKTIWTPEYTTISELFSSMSDYTIADSVLLITQLYEIYSKQLNPTKSFDELYSLMEVMLSDFQDIDNNLVDPEKLFVNIDDLKQLTDYSFLEENQLRAIEEFYKHFLENVNPNTQLKTNFKTLWNCLPDIYNKFHEALLNPSSDTPMVYEGMLKKSVIEALKSEDDNIRQAADSRLTSHTYVMVGFNVLNKTELELFKYLKKHRDTKFYWDYDIAYAKRSSENSNLLGKYEAGQFILDNIYRLGSEFNDNDIYNNMCKPKNIKFIQSPTENAQTRYLDQWVTSNVKEGAPLRESAIILCNENLLQPVLHSIPTKRKITITKKKETQKPMQLDLFGSNEDVIETEVIEKDIAMNVTMGLPLSETPIFSLIQALLELQIHGKSRSGAWRYKYVSAVLKHSYIRKLAGKDCYAILAYFTKNNVVFPNAADFRSNKVLNKIFTPVSNGKNSGRKLTEYLSDIITLISKSYQSVALSKNFTLQLYKESLFLAYTVVNRIHTLQENCTAFAVNDETLARLIRQFLRSATIPFHGEPAIGLQVMGLLETRNLDFKNIVMLSVNEGQMPKSDKRPSLIPYSLKAAYGLTTIEKEVSLYTYYYYRLLQRAENITLIYNSNTEGGSKGEMSRFMLQTLAESKTLFNDKQTIELLSFTSNSKIISTQKYSVKKDDSILDKLIERFNEKRTLSPSAINTYLSCPLKFYFNYIAGLRVDESVSEDIDNPMFGLIFHHAMQKLYTPFCEQKEKASSSKLRAMAEDTVLITQHLNNAFAVQLFKKPEKTEDGKDINYTTDGANRIEMNGTQLINRHVIHGFIVNQLHSDAKMAEDKENEGGYMEIMHIEEGKYETFQNVNVEKKEGTIAHKVVLGGIIDRMDYLYSPQGTSVRIVDYKTSSKPHTANLIADLFDTEKHSGNYHILQTLYYAKVICENKEFENVCVQPALMYNSNNKSLKSGIIQFVADPESIKPGARPKKQEIADFNDAEYKQEFDKRIEKVISDIFAPTEFAQCEDTHTCKYCDFLSFCRRKIAETNF